MKILAGFAVICALVVFTPLPAASKTDGLRNSEQIEVSAQRRRAYSRNWHRNRHWRGHRHWRRPVVVYRPAYRRAWGGPVVWAGPGWGPAWGPYWGPYWGPRWGPWGGPWGRPRGWGVGFYW